MPTGETLLRHVRAWARRGVCIALPADGQGPDWITAGHEDPGAGGVLVTGAQRWATAGNTLVVDNPPSPLPAIPGVTSHDAVGSIGLSTMDPNQPAQTSKDSIRSLGDVTEIVHTALVNIGANTAGGRTKLDGANRTWSLAGLGGASSATRITVGFSMDVNRNIPAGQSHPVHYAAYDLERGANARHAYLSELVLPDDTWCVLVGNTTEVHWRPVGGTWTTVPLDDVLGDLPSARPAIASGVPVLGNVREMTPMPKISAAIYACSTNQGSEAAMTAHIKDIWDTWGV